MSSRVWHWRLLAVLSSCAVMLAGCAAPSRPVQQRLPTTQPPVSGQTPTPAPAPLATLKLPPTAASQLIDRVSWGINASSLAAIDRLGAERYLLAQLRPGPASLPTAVQQQIDAMTISQRSMTDLAIELEQRRKDTRPTGDDDAKKTARRGYQQELNRLAREAAERSLLQALYSPNQLQEQMTWFWLNHFSVHERKRDLRAMVGDYEQNAIRPHALKKFRDLLSATVHHPAMLRYLDNDRNAVNRINENYARELMELHTLGVDGGYSQRDVQELARILTGVGVNLESGAPRVRPALQAQYVRRGVFEFNPNRHDYGDKTFLGQPIRSRGLAEVDEAIDRLSRQPATARFISRAMAIYLAGDTPSPALVESMASAFLQSDGDIAVTLSTLFSAPEFAASLGKKFKDPIHYVLSSVRLAHDGTPLQSAAPLVTWLQRMGEPLYGRQTPDGYPLLETAWASAGQMTTRFEFARALGSGSAGLFKREPADASRLPQPQLSSAFFHKAIEARLSAATRQALGQASSEQEWNTFFLSSPEMMRR